jgi:hypothetical protein
LVAIAPTPAETNPVAPVPATIPVAAVPAAAVEPAAAVDPAAPDAVALELAECPTWVTISFFSSTNGPIGISAASALFVSLS